MAKQKLVAKQRFDDGSKKHPSSGKPVDYEIGEAYAGDVVQAESAMRNGLLCTEAELKMSKEVLDEKDRTIRQLEEKLDKANKSIDALQAKLDAPAGDEDGGEAKPAKRGRKAKTEDAETVE
jgi:hypothetical protein